MKTLIVGFDSAWTPAKQGAIVGAICDERGFLQHIGPPHLAAFADAERAIAEWQAEHAPDFTLILIDQPTIVKNSGGQRPVEHLVCSSVSARKGGMQPANTSRSDMFGPSAPIWSFLERFGGPADPRRSLPCTAVMETYPVLAMIALGWFRPGERARGTLLKYNPGRRKTFRAEDWQELCQRMSQFFREHGMGEIALWIEGVSELAWPRKSDQDKLDACICLVVALLAARGNDLLMVGDVETGYIVVPHDTSLLLELERRCGDTKCAPATWVGVLRLHWASGAGALAALEG